MAVPSYEEFRELVKRDLQTREWFEDMSDEELENYLRNEDSEREMKSNYAHDLKRLENGEIEETVFRQGCVHAVSHCLWMMYD